MKNVREWRPHVTSEILGPQGVVIDEAVLEAIREFCRLSWIWRETLATFATVSGTAEYILVMPEHASLEGVRRMRHSGGGAILPKSDEELERYYGVGWEDETAATPEFFNRPLPGRVLLVPIPSSAVTVTVKAYLKPSQTATEVPGFFLTDLRKSIIQGVLGLLFMQTGTPWYDPRKGQFEERRFKESAGKARVVAEQDGSDEIMVIRQPRFGGLPR